MEKVQKILCDAIIKKGDKFLIIKRSSSEKIFPDKWEFPSGKVGFGEHPIETLKRETKEETNLDVEVIKLVNFKSYIFDTKDHKRHNIQLMFLCNALNEDVKLNPKEHDNHAWVTREEMKNYDIFEDMPDFIKDL